MPITGARRPRVALIDVDGTLVDSNDAHARAWLDAFREAGCTEVTFDLLRPLIGLGAAELLPRSIGVRADSDLGQRVAARRAQLFTAYYLPGVRPFVGTRALLERMKRSQLTIVVVSTDGEEQTTSLLAAGGVIDLVDDIVTRGDIRGPDPRPDALQMAVRRAGCPRELAVFLADAPYDVETGLRAGVEVVALRCGGWSDTALKGAAAVYDDARDLLYQFATSPFSPVRALEFVSALPTWVEPHQAREA